MKNQTVPCSMAPPSLGLSMKPRYIEFFTNGRVLRDWVFMLPVILFNHKPIHTSDGISHWMNTGTLALKPSGGDFSPGDKGNGKYCQEKVALGLGVSRVQLLASHQDLLLVFCPSIWTPVDLTSFLPLQCS